MKQQQQQQRKRETFLSLYPHESQLVDARRLDTARFDKSPKKSNRASISVWRHTHKQTTAAHKIESVDDDHHHFTSIYLVHMAVLASCRRCTAAAAAVAAGCCAPAADRNRARVPDDAGNDADDGGVAAAAAGVAAVGVADDDDGGVAGAVGGVVVGGGRRWSPNPSSGNHLLRHRKPRRLQKANRPPLGAAGARGGPRPMNLTREPFLPFRSASGRPASCTLLRETQI